jgi:hypothetical protein
MTAKPWDLGIIPCTSGKRPAGLTPLTLYKGGPFALSLRHAQQRCHQVMIMSAHYGLLRLSDPIRYYDAYLPTLTPEQRGALLGRLKHQLPQLAGLRVLSYLPKAYYLALLEADPTIVARFQRPYRKLPSLVLFKTLSNEIKHYGIHPARR